LKLAGPVADFFVERHWYMYWFGNTFWAPPIQV